MDALDSVRWTVGQCRVWHRSPRGPSVCGPSVYLWPQVTRSNQTIKFERVSLTWSHLPRGRSLHTNTHTQTTFICTHLKGTHTNFTQNNTGIDTETCGHAPAGLKDSFYSLKNPSLIHTYTLCVCVCSSDPAWTLTSLNSIMIHYAVNHIHVHIQTHTYVNLSERRALRTYGCINIQTWSEDMKYRRWEKESICSLFSFSLSFVMDFDFVFWVRRRGLAVH